VREVELEIQCDGNRLIGGAAVPVEPRALVLLLHGIPSINPPEPGDTGYPGLARTFAGHGYAAAWVDMRAARDSPGFFSIEGWVADATAALQAARRLEGLESVRAAIVGSSAGGAVATVATARGAQVDALALLAAPARWVSFAGHPEAGVRRITREAGMAVAPEVHDDPGAWADEFRVVSTAEAIGDVDVPVLVVHGDADDVVPVAHASDIAAAAPTAEVHIIEGAGHQLRKVPEALDVVLGWLGRVL
jgi:pimeloyl-ACP methyl ester carboxylesterase